MDIREARPDDYDAAGDVAVAAYGEFYGANLGSYGGHLRDVATRARGAVVMVAIDEGHVVGTVTYVPEASSPYAEGLRPGEVGIRMLAVAPGHKRRGVGRALSLACVERARGEGRSAVVLHADQIMDASQQLYRSLGFRREPTRDFRPDEVTFLVCYVLEL